MNKNFAEELRLFKEFKKNYKFRQLPLEEVGGTLFCCGQPLFDAEGNLIGECESWINIAYMIKSPLSKMLSNLFPYDFEFRGVPVKSLEGFFQGIKFRNSELQKTVFAYSGINACYTRAVSDFCRLNDGVLYWQGEPIKRDSAEYAEFVDELYVSALQNPLYRRVLQSVNRPLIHSIGKTDKRETVLTRYEYEAEINCLAQYVKQCG